MHIPTTTPDREQDSISKQTLVVIDDEPFLKECLVEAIHTAFPHTHVVGISGIDELHHLDHAMVALVLLRIQPHSEAGHWPETEARDIVRQYPNTPIVILSPCMNASALREIMALGIRGVIPATTSFKIAVAALQLVMAGGIYYPCLLNGDLQIFTGFQEPEQRAPETSNPIVSSQSARSFLTIVERSDELLRKDISEPSAIFTARELEVLEALQKGWSNKWIAHSLHISENTIKVHIQRIMRKLNATNRTEAVIRHRQLSGIK
jgi:DNA-binding NarL/FixJ family response regulator